MKRQALTDGSGKWFNIDSAEVFDEDTNWNGNNHISVNTGSQWDHEKLYRTKSGRWVLCSWSQWQGSTDSWVEIDNEAAAKWLAMNDHEPHNACKEAFEALEM